MHSEPGGQRAEPDLDSPTELQPPHGQGLCLGVLPCALASPPARLVHGLAFEIVVKRAYVYGMCTGRAP
jgi:hypothetical protein